MLKCSITENTDLTYCLFCCLYGCALVCVCVCLWVCVFVSMCVCVTFLCDENKFWMHFYSVWSKKKFCKKIQIFQFFPKKYLSDWIYKILDIFSQGFIFTISSLYSSLERSSSMANYFKLKVNQPHSISIWWIVMMK